MTGTSLMELHCMPGAGSNNENLHPITQRKRNKLVRLQRGPAEVTGDIPDGIIIISRQSTVVTTQLERQSMWESVDLEVLYIHTVHICTYTCMLCTHTDHT